MHGCIFDGRMVDITHADIPVHNLFITHPNGQSVSIFLLHWFSTEKCSKSVLMLCWRAAGIATLLATFGIAPAAPILKVNVSDSGSSSAQPQ